MANNSSSVDPNNNLDYILLFRLIVWGYVGMGLSLFGIFGNVITVLVLTSPSMRTTSTNIYLTALSCSNVLFLLIFIPSYSMRYLIGYELYKTNQPPFAFEILLTRLPTSPIYNTILLSIIYLTIAVSMDRLILVKFPLKAKRILTTRTTLITILSIYIFSIVYCIPYWLEQRYHPEYKQCRLTKIGKKIHKYTRIYIYIPVVYLIPFITLTCINVTIIQNLIAKKRRKKSLCGPANKKKQADYHITLMLVTVIIVFVLCQLPLLVLNAWHAIDPQGSYNSFYFHSLNIIGVLLIVFNTSTNFLLYCFFGQKFRQTLIEFVFRIIPFKHKSTQLQTRPSTMGKLEYQQPLLENNAEQSKLKQPTKSQQQQIQQPRVSDDSRLKVNIVENNKPTMNDANQQISKNAPNNHNSIPNTSTNLEESCLPITKSDPISITNDNISSNFDQRLSLCTIANGKQLLLLRI